MTPVIDKLLDRAMRAIEILLALAFLVAIALNFANVIGRYVFGHSILWADEIQIFIMIAITFIGAAVVTWRRDHLRMDVVARLLPKRAQAVLKLGEQLIVVMLTGFVLFHALVYTLRIHEIGRTSDTARVPMWIPHGAVVIGFALIALAAVWILIRLIRTGQLHSDGPAKPNGGPS